VGRAPALGAHPVVRVVAPCGTLIGHETALQAGLLRLERAGCHVRFDARRAAADARGYLAGDDAARADELLSALAEPGVDVVWFARGGSGGARTAGWVLDAAARLAPRHVVGFSDATTLLNALAARLGWVVHHGPVVTSLGRPEVLEFDLDAGLDALRGGPQAPTQAPPALCGRLLGGNLTVLASLAGTRLFPAAPAAPGAVWLLEDVGEAPYRLDRSLTQLREAGLFAGAAGVWLGDLCLSAEDTPRVVESVRADLGELPVVTHAPAGHRGRMEMLPIGAWVEVDAAGGWRRRG
jgi:muramoyltetrapeptide carboxypeptidase